ncbi:hypothetical protein M0813_19243 [Anaeramoeba flamelloides]|uniref:RGS domain-containing protein n=1 Tax=Anaeramoeba flamelloides TaxID=1746091 RepID=A0ABQ8YPP5_9EUKA|nr:hypothetical protein M0813_19243 [Anaeramoeba flamelloides]
MFLAIFFHFLLMLLFILMIRLENGVRRKPDGKCEYGKAFVPLISFVTVVHIILFSYFLFKIWKIKDNFKIRNQLYMIYLTCILTFLLELSKVTIKEYMMWQWTFSLVLIIQYLIVLGYPLWLSRKQHSLKHNKNDNEFNDNSVDKFTHILKDKNKSKYFFKFLQLDYSIENLLFYQAVTSFEKINPNKKSKKKKYCQQIIKNFIQVDARLEINLEHAIRKSTIKSAEKDPTNSSCFQQAKKKIFFLMLSASYPTFLDSKQYYEMMIELDQINIEIGGERELQLNPLGGDEDTGGDDHENGNQLSNDTTKDSGNETKTENEINNCDDEEDHNQNEPNTVEESENSDQNKTSSETSNSGSDSN